MHETPQGRRLFSLVALFSFGGGGGGREGGGEAEGKPEIVAILFPPFVRSLGASVVRLWTFLHPRNAVVKRATGSKKDR